MTDREQADQLIQIGDLDGALTVWSGIVSSDPSPKDLLDYGYLLNQLYMFTDAEGIFHRLLNHPDTDSSHLASAAKWLSKRSRFDQAASFLGKACKLKPKNLDYRVLLVTCLERSGQDEEALSVVHSILNQQPLHAQAVRLCAHIERRQGKLNEARERMESFLKESNSTENWKVKYELAGVLDRVGEHQAAMQTLLESKEEIRQQADQFFDVWRVASTRQWELTKLVTSNQLEQWGQSADPITPQLRLVLLAGFPRSGTTLLEQILGTHPECVGTDESGIIASQFRDPIVMSADSPASAIAELNSFDNEQLSSGRAEYVRCTEEYVGEQLGDKLLIEKDPLLTCDLHLPLRLFPDAKILMPLRDPRDVVISFFFTLVPLSSGSAAAISIEESCKYYAEVMRHWLYFKEIIPSERWMETRYEDLIDQPEIQTRKMAQFLNIEWSPDMLSHHRKKPTKLISTPTYDDVTKPLYKRSIKRWKNYEKWLEPHMHYLDSYITAFGYENEIDRHSPNAY